MLVWAALFGVLFFGELPSVAAIAGARLLHVAVNWKDYAAHPLAAFAFWDGGLAYLGQTTQAQPIIDDAQTRLSRSESGLIPVDRLKLTRFTGRALGHLPTETALPGLLRLARYPAGFKCNQSLAFIPR